MTRSDALAFSTEAVEPRGLRTISFLRRGSPSVGDHFDWMVCAERLSEGDCDTLLSRIAHIHENPVRERIVDEEL